MNFKKNITESKNKTRKIKEVLKLEKDEKTNEFKLPIRDIRKIKNKAKKKRKKDEFSKRINSNNYIVEVENLSKIYISGGNKATKVLVDLNLKIKKGDFVVLFGKSGSGKSTLLNIISGLDRPTDGQVIVCNKNLPYLSNNELTKFRRDYLAFIFQQYYLLNNVTGFENAETGQYLQKNKNKLVDIKKYFEEFELLDAMNKYPSQMSGGQQQRISIIRALSKNADIIFADEPTGALDKKTSKIVLKLLKKIHETQKKTIIMVSHNSDVAKHANRIIVLNNGKIADEIDN